MNSKYNYIYIILSLSIIGSCFITDFGITWDDPIQRDHGMVSFDYINDKLGNLLSDTSFTEHKLESYEYKYYGTMFQTLAFGLEQIFNLQTTSGYFYLRHFLVFLLFCVALIAFYKTLLIRYQGVFLSLIGLLMLICSPRILGHAFFNVKDSVFLSFYVISLFILLKYISTEKLKWILMLGVFVGLTISIRSLGIYLVPLSLLGLVLMFISKSKHAFQLTILNILIFLSFSCLSTILFWPVLWENPIENFISSFSALSKYDWQGDVLLHGTFLKATDVPWSYSIQWICISNPVIFLVLSVAGVILFIIQSIRKLYTKFEVPKEMVMDLLMFLAFLGPLVAVAYFNSTLYDGWRHTHFIWPPILYFSVLAVKDLVSKISIHMNEKQIQRIRAILLAVIIVPVLIIVIRIHPFQNLYFNILAKKPWVENYELDYWGQGYKKTYQRFARKLRDGKSYKIHGANYPAWECYRTLSETEKEKLAYAWDTDNADYYISNFRYQWERDKYLYKKFPMQHPVYIEKICGQAIYGVFKINGKENQ